MTEVEVFTDGACSGNPGPGGWGAILAAKGKERELSGAEALTTNNRMELMAAIGALEALTRPCAVTLTTDSVYLRDGVTQWIHGWKRNGWRTADKKPVKNVDLWQRLDAAAAPHQVKWLWVKGHAGHPQNERCDALARAAIADMLRKGTAARVEHDLACRARGRIGETSEILPCKGSTIPIFLQPSALKLPSPLISCMAVLRLLSYGPADPVLARSRVACDHTVVRSIARNAKVS